MLTADPSSWFFPASAITMAVFAGVATYGFVVSLVRQQLIKDAFDLPQTGPVSPTDDL